MRVLLAGGVFRLSAEERSRRQPAPELVLVEGLRRHGVQVQACRLEDRSAVALARRSDVVHVHHLSKAAVLAALSPLARPFVFSPHASGTPRQPRQRIGQEVVMSRADAVVCGSENEAAALRARHDLPDSRIAVIPNGIAMDGILPHRRRIAPEDQIVLLFVGQLAPVKQVHRVIEALPRLPRQVILRLVYHNDTLESALRERAYALGVAHRVVFVGQRSGAALLDEYRRAHLLVLPSASEALPSVVTEALLTGLPVVASDVGGVPEQVRDAGRLVGPGASTPVAPVIDEVLRSYETFACRAVDRARCVAVDYSVDQMIDRHLTLYERLTTRKSA